MIRFDNVSKRYPEGRDALQAVSFHLPAGAMAFLTGHSGAGKSTLLKLVALLERSSRGQLFLDGENLSRTKARRIPYVRRKIGMIFQNYRLLFDRTVFDNVALPLVIAGYRHQDIRRRVRAALDKVGLLDKERSLPINVSALPVRWSTNHPCCSPTNPPVTSTRTCRETSWACLSSSTRSESPC
jgi:cell division transport system ATP-binding protein